MPREKLERKHEEREEKAESGIVLSDIVKEKPHTAEIVAAGDVEEVTVNKGDTVVFAKYAGTEIKLDDTDYMILDAEDVLGVFTTPPYGEGSTVERQRLDQEIRDLSSGKRAFLARLIPMVVRGVASGSGRGLRAAETALREFTEAEHELPEDSEDLSPELAQQLDAENLLGVWADYAELERRSVDGSMMRERLGVRRQRLEQMRSSGDLVGVRLPFRSSYYYPVWQFDPATGRPLSGLRGLVEAARSAGMDELAIDGFMMNPQAGEGEPPAEAFKRDPDSRQRVIQAVRAARSGGS